MFYSFWDFFGLAKILVGLGLLSPPTPKFDPMPKLDPIKAARARAEVDRFKTTFGLGVPTEREAKFHEKINSKGDVSS